MSTNNISTTARLETIYDKLVPDPAPATGSWDSGKIAISAISVVEIVYLVEKKRLSEIALEVIRKALNNPNHVFGESYLTVEVADAMRNVPRHEVPDMPDRIAAATALFLNVPLLSRDGRIRASRVKTIWGEDHLVSLRHPAAPPMRRSTVGAFLSPTVQPADTSSESSAPSIPPL